MEERFEEAMQKLFTAKWNIPQAVAFLERRACKEEWGRMKEEFREYCSKHGPSYREGKVTAGSGLPLADSGL